MEVDDADTHGGLAPDVQLALLVLQWSGWCQIQQIVVAIHQRRVHELGGGCQKTMGWNNLLPHRVELEFESVMAPGPGRSLCAVTWRD